MASPTIALQINTSYQQTPLTTSALAGVAAANKVAVQTPPSVQVQVRLSPPSHTGVPVGGPGADVKGAALNYSGNADVTPAVKSS